MPPYKPNLIQLRNVACLVILAFAVRYLYNNLYFRRQIGVDDEMHLNGGQQQAQEVSAFENPVQKVKI